MALGEGPWFNLLSSWCTDWQNFHSATCHLNKYFPSLEADNCTHPAQFSIRGLMLRMGLGLVIVTSLRSGLGHTYNQQC